MAGCANNRAMVGAGSASPIAFGLGQGVLMVMQAWLLATLLHGFIIEGSTPEHPPLFISLLLVT